MASQFDLSKPWYHWRDGVMWQRMEGGQVVVARIPDAMVANKAEWEFVIPAAEWASIVASVSVRGETGDTWREALAFHTGGV